VKIPGGRVHYGDPGHAKDVELDAFEIMKYEVTNQQWWDYLWDEQKRLMRQGRFAAAVPRHWGWKANTTSLGFPRVPTGLHDLPVVHVTWYQANDFCTVYLRKKLKCGAAYLPTSAQWEMAARGTEDVRRYPWGDEASVDRGGVRELLGNVRETGIRGPSEVRRFDRDRSPFGVIGMGGNVSEFVGFPAANRMAYKGGSFADPVVDAAIHIETTIPPGSTFTWSNVGFRAARDVE
jgi:formylglycine-generating enzyme required for sulfatase activity